MSNPQSIQQKSNQKKSRKNSSQEHLPSSPQITELECKKKNEQFQELNKSLENKIMLSSKQITEFKTENSNILIDQEYYQTLVTKYSKKLEELKKTIQEITQPERTLIDESQTTIDQIKNQNIRTLLESQQNLTPEQKQKILQFADKALINSLSTKKLQQIADRLTQENLAIKDELSKYEKQKSAPKVCITCGEEYYPWQNNDKSCVYHPGKIKFFSCRQCGGDEYYTCCLTCSNCKKGCRTRKHMANQ